jgi:hypothetical protein
MAGPSLASHAIQASRIFQDRLTLQSSPSRHRPGVKIKNPSGCGGLIEKYRKPVYGVTLYDEGKDRIIYPAGESTYKGLFYPTPARSQNAVPGLSEESCITGLT